MWITLFIHMFSTSRRGLASAWKIRKIREIRKIRKIREMRGGPASARSGLFRPAPLIANHARLALFGLLPLAAANLPGLVRPVAYG